MRTAILRGLRPTSLILDVQPHSKWSQMDKTLVVAFQIFTDEIDQNSGMPMWLTRSMDPAIGFTVETRTDLAAQATEAWDEKHRKDKRHGVKRFAVPVDVLTEQPLVYGGLTREQFRLSASQVERDAESGEIEDLIERRRPVGGYNAAEYGDGVTNPA